MLKRTEWNFTLLDATTADIDKICVWEYARECEPLCTAIAELRDFVRSRTGIRDKKHLALAMYALVPGKKYVSPTPAEKASHCASEELFDLLEVIDAIVGRYNWGLFCSHEFPEKPWCEEGSDCPIRRAHRLWPEGAIRGGATIQSKGFVVPNTKAQNKEPKNLPSTFATKHLPYIHHLDTTFDIPTRSILGVGQLEEDLAQAFGIASASVAGESEDEAAASGVGNVNSEDLALHCFVVTGRNLSLNSKESILDRIKKHLDRLDRRKLSPADLFVPNLSRDLPLVWLRNLGIMRILHVSSPTQLQALAASGKLSEDVISKVKLRSVKTCRKLRGDVLPTFKQLFNVSPDDKPISWSLHELWP